MPGGGPGYSGRGMVDNVRAFVSWWVLCAALWLLLVDRTATDELLVGAGVALAAAGAATAVRRQRIGVGRPRPSWVGSALVRQSVGLLADLWPLARTLVLRGILRRPAPGGGDGLSLVPYARVTDDPGDLAHRALTETLGSLAPNTIVVAIDRDRRLLVAHQLELTDDVAAQASPLPEDLA